jgi:hypothetical protein
MTIAQYIADRNKGLPVAQEVRHSIDHWPFILYINLTPIFIFVLT